MATRRSTRTRRPPESFEATTYAADILYTQLKNADTMSDFLSTLFLCFKPACYRPDLWNGRSEHGGIYRMVRGRCSKIDLNHDEVLRLALDYSKNELDDSALSALMSRSKLPPSEIREFLHTVGSEGDEEDAAEGDDDDDDDGNEEEEDGDYKEGEEDDDDEEDDDEEEEEEELEDDDEDDDEEVTGEEHEGDEDDDDEEQDGDTVEPSAELDEE
jgi:hypothetical protein